MATEAEKDKKRLITKRGQIKAKLTRFKAYFENLTQQDDVEELRLRLSSVKPCLAEFESQQDQLELLDEETDHTIEHGEFETNYFNIISKAEKFIKQTSPYTQDIQNNTPSSCAGNICHDNGSSTAGVRLPTINLPTFSGKFDEWMSFSDSFHSLIDQNGQLSNIQKLQYLKGALKGPASEVLQNLEITSNNYNVALELLKKQYHNVRIIVQQHIKALFDLPPVQRDKPHSLRQLVTSTLTHIRALEALKVKTENWDPIVIHLITSRLDQTSHKEWELSTKPDEFPSLDSLIDYLLKRSQTLESIASNHARDTAQILDKSTHNSSRSKNQAKYFNTKSHMSSNYNICCLCGGKHKIFQCSELQSGSYSNKVTKLNSANVCTNCLNYGHTVDKCISSSSCRKCSRKHNTLIHPADFKHTVGQTTNSKGSTTPQQQHEETKNLLSSSVVGLTQGILNTALVQVTGPTGRVVNCRALLDNGSECCYITENIVQQLGLRKTRQNIQVSGVNQTIQNVKASTTATLKSSVTNYKTNLQFLIISKITDRVPSEKIDLTNIQFPNHITLADPSFGTPGKVDVLIGQEIFWDLICIGQIRTPGLPTLQKTKLGWLVGGTVQTSNIESNNRTTCNLATLDKQLQKFWALEEPVHKHHLTADEVHCEEHFKANTRREADGRYIVKMPLRAETTELGESKEIAKKRFIQVERRLERDPSLKRQYSNFMAEYLHLGHMELVTEKHNSLQAPQYFLPHHPVLKCSSTTTKLRVVFDASAKSTSGESLNSLQLVGPTVQADIFSTISRFRMHTYVMTADLEKMYRQILIDESQKDLLQIFWRENKNDPLQVYRLNTVTYGTASAPYLATRTLQQLANDEETSFPEAAPVLRNDFYMDDLLTGAETLEKASELQRQLLEMLSRGRFHLRKWNSNCSELLYNLPEQMRERHPQQFPTDDNSSIKTLGLWWDAERDTFQFRYSPVERKHPVQLSKRIVLSDIARLFDPLGLVAPIIVRPKLLLQELWKLKLDWDESLPMHLHTQWMSIQRCLQNLDEIKIPRQVTHPSLSGRLEIHGFADSSERAYGGVVYLRHEDADGKVKVSLLCSKSRVAPLHSTSLPRLELCAALLLTEVVTQVQSALQISSDNTTYWTDSTVTLAWIHAEPARWTTFVANRVAKIQEITKTSNWRHVNTQCNPADLVSRGETALNLATSQLWWHGPTWLSQPQIYWPNSPPNRNNAPEQRKPTTTALVSTKQTTHVLQDLLDRFSSLHKINRVLAYCNRFIGNISPQQQSLYGPLTVTEIQNAKNTLIKYVQNVNFSSEIKKMSQKKPILADSKLLSLDPFLDNDGLVRVGGRLQQSHLSYDNRHPIILPKNHKLTDMIAKTEHLRNLHCGPNALLCAIRLQYWPINGRDLVRKITHQCLKCFRARPKTLQQKMGVLPAARVTPARPFVHTGVDYCGPFYVKQSKRRGSKPAKAYVAVFVCLATKAAHLELVTDLTTDTFLGALRRFISRRGICTEILSDNGTNFVGANREIQELYNFFKDEAPAIINGATNEGVKWSFNPPYAPHMGGLWEASVKSFKHHLRRIIGTASITFEELTTVITQIEAVLNSRPLTPLSSDPSDLSVLTPSHFLIGGSLMALPEPSVTHIPENRLSRWQRVQRLVQHFWSRWSSEYLTNLQQRSKWKSASASLQAGSLVLLKDDHLPPLSWPMGRVISLHPGKDDIIRVVTVKTATGSCQRNVNKLCLVPIEC